MSERSTRRGALGRGVALLGGLVGLGAATEATAAPPGATTLAFHVRGLTHDRRGLRRRGDPLTLQGELLDRPGGRRVGELHAAAFTLRGPGGAGPSELELHTLVLEDGTLVGSGTGDAGGGAYAILGGTGRYAGARGSYAVRRSHEPGAGDAELVVTLL